MSLPAVSQESAAVLSMIERVATDPQADITKLEKMLDMQERILNRNAEQAFSADLALMQGELPLVIKNGEGHNKARYAKLEDINETIRPTLQRYGFAVTFRTNQNEKSVSITAILSHKMGHREETQLVMPLDTSGNKNAVQAIGSTVSYGKRYALCALLNISTGDDTDGVINQGPQKLSVAQISDLRNALNVAGYQEKDFLLAAGVSDISDIYADRFEVAKNHIKGYANASH